MENCSEKRKKELTTNIPNSMDKCQKQHAE